MHPTMQKSAIAILLFLLPMLGSSNVAEPGVWNSGGAGNYTLLFPGDSSYYQKIQMQQELVLIQLYPGFAVVKGTYWMRNTTADTIVMNAGYPVNSGFEQITNQGFGKMNVDFDDLYALRVSTNEIPREFSRKEIENTQVSSYGDRQDWYVWQDTFPPDTTSRIEIYFMVNTNASEMIDDYTHSNDNVFVYLLESGASWKPPIGKGDFIVQLMDGVEADGIRGISPDSIFLIDQQKKMLYYHFENFIPKEDKNNIVIAYGKKIDYFNFGNIVKNADMYFKKINQLEKISFNKSTSSLFSPGNPYIFSSLTNNPLVILFVIISIGILVIIFIAIRLAR